NNLGWASASCEITWVEQVLLGQARGKSRGGGMDQALQAIVCRAICASRIDRGGPSRDIAGGPALLEIKRGSVGALGALFKVCFVASGATWGCVAWTISMCT